MSESLESAARVVDLAMERVSLLDPASARVARDLKEAIEGFHKAGLVAIVKALQADERGTQILHDLVDDPAVYGLLLVHSIVKPDPLTLAHRALAEVRPYIESQGGGVELVEVTPPVARIRLTGACQGCSASSSTLRQAVELALVTQVPGVETVEVLPASTATLIPVSSLRVRSAAQG